MVVGVFVDYRRSASGLQGIVVITGRACALWGLWEHLSARKWRGRFNSHSNDPTNETERNWLHWKARNRRGHFKPQQATTRPSGQKETYYSGNQRNRKRKHSLPLSRLHSEIHLLERSSRFARAVCVFYSVENQHTMGLISAWKTSHKQNNKYLSRLR